MDEWLAEVSPVPRAQLAEVDLQRRQLLLDAIAKLSGEGIELGERGAVLLPV